jgi:N-methylhydantoinase A
VFLGKTDGFVEVPVYDGKSLGAGARLVGPVLIEEPTTTILLLASQAATVNSQGDYLVELDR